MGRKSIPLTEKKKEDVKLLKAADIFKLKRIWIILLAPVSLLLLFASKKSEDFAENVVGNGIFRAVAFLYSRITGLLPFSLMELGIILSPVIVLAVLIRFFYVLVKHKIKEKYPFTRGYYALKWLINILDVASLAVFLLIVGCTCNYNRTPFAERYGISMNYSYEKSDADEVLEYIKEYENTHEVDKETYYYADGSSAELTSLEGQLQIAETMPKGENKVGDLYVLVLELTKRANEVRERLAKYEDADGVFRLSLMETEKECGDLSEKEIYALKTKRLKKVMKLSKNAVSELNSKYPTISKYLPSPKLIYNTEFMNKIEIVGVFCPFTMEANVDGAVPDYSIGFTACHELGHLSGYIKENEADFIAYLACTNSDDDILLYSGYTEALITAGNALYSSSPELFSLARRGYSDAVVRDFTDNSKFWEKYNEKPAAVVANKINDSYIKASGDDNGVKAYTLVVELLLALIREGKI